MKKTTIFLAIFGVLCMGAYRQSEDDNPQNGVGQTTEIGTIFYSGETYPIGYRCMVCEHNNKGHRVFMPYRRGAEYDALQHIVDVHKGKVEAVAHGHNPSIHFRYVNTTNGQNNLSANWQIGAVIFSHKSLTGGDGYWCELCHGKHSSSNHNKKYAKGSFEDALKHILQAHSGKTEAIFSKIPDQWTKASEIYFRYAQKMPN